MSSKTMWRSRRFMTGTAAAMSVGALALVGCGSAKDSATSTAASAAKAKAAEDTAIRSVLGQLQMASRAGNGGLICRQIFTPKLAASVTKAATSHSCAKEVRKKLFSPVTRLTVQKVDITDAANASATVKELNGNTSTIFFALQSGQWRIRSIQPA